MKISEVSKATHLPISTIRYYERVGLIHDDYFVREDNGYRNYSTSVVPHLQFISKLLENGFSISELLQISDTFGSSPTTEENIQLLRQKINEVKKKIANLEASEKILQKMLAHKMEQL
ncbi:MerR family transcriptional regulator [Enterococcus sp. DIV0756]|uniref:MerR family transcriptional regulator n=1 Tax=Enterococcus sp. DIV0756 TaxID=2774636 RepID=UPI003F2762E4